MRREVRLAASIALAVAVAAFCLTLMAPSAPRAAAFHRLGATYSSSTGTPITFEVSPEGTVEEIQIYTGACPDFIIGAGGAYPDEGQVTHPFSLHNVLYYGPWTVEIMISGAFSWDGTAAGTWAVDADAGFFQCSANGTWQAETPTNGDTDGDGCLDVDEQQTALGSELSGGLRDYQNPWDYFNPTHDGQNRIDDILSVVYKYGLNQGDAGYSTNYDRTYMGPNQWNLGPPNGQIRVDDILAAIYQYAHDCP